jgi:hypothetical protein
MANKRILGKTVARPIPPKEKAIREIKAAVLLAGNKPQLRRGKTPAITKPLTKKRIF